MSLKSLLEKAGVIQEEDQVVVKAPIVQNKPVEQRSFNIPPSTTTKTIVGLSK